MNPAQFAAYRHEAVHQLMRLNEECKNTFRVTLWPRWDYDFEAGTLTFSESGAPKVIASIQVVGTSSKSGGTWLWAWANKSLPDKVTKAVRKVQEFGEAENLTELTQESLPDDEYLGWGMSAVAAKILGSKGAYRCPGDNGFVYVVYSSLRFADADDAKQLACAVHGSGFSTYVCEHLAANPRQVEAHPVDARHNLIDLDLEHIARLRAIDIDRTGDRVRRAAWRDNFGANSREIVDCNTRHEPVAKQHQRFHDDRVARFDRQNRRLGTIEESDLRRFRGGR